MKPLLARLLRVIACELVGHPSRVVGHGLLRCGSCEAAFLDVDAMHRGLDQMVEIKEQTRTRYWS